MRGNWRAHIRVSVDCVQRDAVQPSTQQKLCSETSLSSARPRSLSFCLNQLPACFVVLSSLKFSKPSPQHASYPCLAIRDSWCFSPSASSQSGGKQKKKKKKMTGVIWWLGLILQPAVTDAGRSVVQQKPPHCHISICSWGRAQPQVKLMTEKTLPNGIRIIWEPGRRCNLSGMWWIKHRLSTNGNEGCQAVSAKTHSGKKLGEKMNETSERDAQSAETCAKAQEVDSQTSSDVFSKIQQPKGFLIKTVIALFRLGWRGYIKHEPTQSEFNKGCNIRPLVSSWGVWIPRGIYRRTEEATSQMTFRETRLKIFVFGELLHNLNSSELSGRIIVWIKRH